MKTLKSAKVLSTAALAALILAAAPKTASAATTANPPAWDAGANWSQNGGNAAQGNGGTQNYTNGDVAANKLQPVDGDILINGELIKTVSNMPVPTDDGHYIRVTMPIQLKFTYDYDQNQFNGSQGMIRNESVHVYTDASSQQQYDYKKVKMTLLDIQESTTGANTVVDETGQNIFKFVENVGVAADSTSKIEFPLEVALTATNGTQIAAYPASKIVGGTVAANGNNAVEINANQSINIELGLIGSQKPSNGELLTTQNALTAHNLSLRFEYIQ